MSGAAPPLSAQVPEFDTYGTDPRWSELHEAVSGLDFERAAGLCEALLDQALLHQP